MDGMTSTSCAKIGGKGPSWVLPHRGASPQPPLTSSDGCFSALLRRVLTNGSGKFQKKRPSLPDGPIGELACSGFERPRFLPLDTDWWNNSYNGYFSIARLNTRFLEQFCLPAWLVRN
jgi:hypothetical protein